MSPRTTGERIADTKVRLATEVDAWVATVDEDGEPRMSLLSILWTDGSLLVATSISSATGRNLSVRDTVRLGLGQTRDVVLIDGAFDVLPEVSAAEGDAFAAHAGFDPRPLPGFAFFRVSPRSIQAWREEDELAGRWILRDGEWLG